MLNDAIGIKTVHKSSCLVIAVIKSSRKRRRNNDCDETSTHSRVQRSESSSENSFLAKFTITNNIISNSLSENYNKILSVFSWYLFFFL